MGAGGNAAPHTGVRWEMSPISACVHPHTLGPGGCLMPPAGAAALLHPRGREGCHCQGGVLWGWDTPGRAGCARQPHGLLAVLGSPVHTQPPTAVKMFLSPAGSSQPTRSPTRDVAPICRCLLGRRGHPDTPPPTVGMSLGHPPAAPSPPAHGGPPARAAPALLSAEQSKGPPLIFIKPLIRRLGGHRDGGDVAVGGGVTVELVPLLLGGAAGASLALAAELSPPWGVGASVQRGRRGPGFQMAPSAPVWGEMGGQLLPSSPAQGKLQSKSLGWGWRRSLGAVVPVGQLLCCPREAAGVLVPTFPCPQRQWQKYLRGWHRPKGWYKPSWQWMSLLRPP